MPQRGKFLSHLAGSIGALKCCIFKNGSILLVSLTPVMLVVVVVRVDGSGHELLALEGTL